MHFSSNVGIPIWVSFESYSKSCVCVSKLLLELFKTWILLNFDQWIALNDIKVKKKWSHLKAPLFQIFSYIRSTKSFLQILPFRNTLKKLDIAPNKSWNVFQLKSSQVETWDPLICYPDHDMTWQYRKVATLDGHVPYCKALLALLRRSKKAQEINVTVPENC